MYISTVSIEASAHAWFLFTMLKRRDRITSKRTSKWDELKNEEWVRERLKALWTRKWKYHRRYNRFISLTSFKLGGLNTEVKTLRGLLHILFHLEYGLRYYLCYKSRLEQGYKNVGHWINRDCIIYRKFINISVSMRAYENHKNEND